QPLVVLEPDERADAADTGIGERKPDAEPERIGQKQQQKRRRRQHEPQAEPVAVHLEPIPRTDVADRPAGNRVLESEIGHQRSGIRLSGIRVSMSRLSSTLPPLIPAHSASLRALTPVFAGYGRA